MYWFIATILLALFAAPGCDTPTTPPPPIDSLTVGLVAYYPLDGSAVDSSGNGHDGIAVATAGVDRFGHPAGAMVLAGDSTSGIVVHHASDLNFAGILDFTISFRYRLTDTALARGGVVCKAANNPGMIGYQVQFESADHLTLLVGTNRGLARLSTSLSADMLWHQITAVISRTTSDLSLYYDAEPVAYDIAHEINGSVDTKAPLLIGMDYNGGDRYGGMIDDVRIYNRSMRRSEVRRLFLSGGS